MKTAIISLLKFYQRAISARRPIRVCKFTPTCSQYMIEAVERFGVKGVILGLERLLRCQPFSRGGYDPVPVKFTLKRMK